MGMGRRVFIGRAAATAGAIGFSSSLLRAADSPANRVVIGIMGLERGRALAKSFDSLPGVEIRYVCDVDQNRLTRAKEEFTKPGKSYPEAVGDYRKILDDKEVDALVCAAPNFWHATATIHGVQAGKHVYVEKPCCHTPREGELMVEAARKYNRAVQVGSQRRSGTTVTEAMALLHAGELGRVYTARAFYGADRKSIGIGKEVPIPQTLDYELWQGPVPRRPYVDNRVPYNWHWFWHYGNGELGNNGIHSIDLCRWGLGVDFPVRVTSAGGRYCYQDDQETPDTHTACFEFEDRKLITWVGHSCNKHNEKDFVTFYGDKGALKIGVEGGYTLFDANDKEIKKQQGTRGDIEHIQNFLAAIRDDKPLSLNAEIEKGYKSTLLCLLGNIAHRTDRALTCDPKTGHVMNNPEAMKLWEREYAPGWELKV